MFEVKTLQPELLPQNGRAFSPSLEGDHAIDDAPGLATERDSNRATSPGQALRPAEPTEIREDGTGQSSVRPTEVRSNGEDDAGQTATRVNLLEAWSDETGDVPQDLQSVRVGPNEVALVPFTSDTELVRLHYCPEAEIQGYVHCNGPGCALCLAGRTVDERALLPVYQPAIQAVGVLAIAPSSRPGALRPQVLPILRSSKRVAMLIRKPDRATFKVGTVELREDMDDGTGAIATFLRRWEAGETTLGSVFPRIDNRDLAAIPSVAAMLRMKGVRLDDHD